MLCWMFPIPTALLSKVAWEDCSRQPQASPGMQVAGPWRTVLTLYLYAGLPWHGWTCPSFLVLQSVSFFLLINQI